MLVLLNESIFTFVNPTFVPLQAAAAQNTTSRLSAGQNNPFYPVANTSKFISRLSGAMDAYRGGMCVHPTNDSVASTCYGYIQGALARLQSIIINQPKHIFSPGQQQKFGEGFYYGYATAGNIANVTFPKH
ncbi:MAG TPA: hypothetical protein VI278_18505 [Nitrososphaeraceae archaeon]